MAARTHSDTQALQHAAVCIMGSFAPNGSSAITATTRKGPGWSVARTSAGLFSVTFSNKYNDLLSATATLQQATAGDQFAQVGTWTAATKILQIRVWDVSDAAVADVAANADNRINFVAWFSNTGMLPVRG